MKLKALHRIILTCLLFLGASAAFGQATAGYSEYFIPGDELNMNFALNDMAPGGGATMHSVISVVAWAPNATVYYDHWENGYNFDPNNPGSTADETYTLATIGATLVFESSNVPTGGAPPGPRTAGTCPGQLNPLGAANGNRCYDGGDHIFVAGGPVTVTRATWIEARGVGNQGCAWEIYPVKPQLTTYVVPFGEDLFANEPAHTFYYGFERVYALIQATDDNTTFTVDLNNDGVPDILNQNRDANWHTAGPGTVNVVNGSPTVAGNATTFTTSLFAGAPITINGVAYNVLSIASNTSLTLTTNYAGVTANAVAYIPADSATVTLQKGQTFLLDRISACPSHANCTTTPGNLITGAVITGSKTLQVKYVAGRGAPVTYAARGLSAFPRGFWTNDYYGPLGQGVTTGPASDSGGGQQRIVDYYLYNPGSTPLTINWQGQTTSGSFAIPGNSTVSYNQSTGGNVPTGSGLYFSANSPFWGVGFGDSQAENYEWGFSLLPTTFLYKQHFMGWAPGSYPRLTAPTNGNGAFLTVAQDNTKIFVDYNNDGVADQTYTLNRLQTQFIGPSNTLGVLPGDLAGSRIWGTGLFSMAYGENGDTAATPTPSLDLGYVALPGTDFVSLVLTTSKSANPTVVSTASGSTTDFTILANTMSYSLDGVSVVDTMPGNWQFVPGFTTIIKPDLTVSSSAPGAGTVTTNGTTAVVGAGTAFNTLTTGTPITIAGLGYTIQSITDATHLTLTATAPAGAGQTYYTSGSGIEPVVTGAGTPASPYVLTWSAAQTGGNMAANQQITIKFRAATTSVFASGTLSQNNVATTGTRTVGSSPAVTQTFTANDFTFVVSGAEQITKSSSVPTSTSLFPGDTFTYTTAVANPAATGTNLLTGVSLYDALPTGLTKVAGTTTLSRNSTVADFFNAVAYTNNNGTRNWAGNWTETDISGNTAGAAAGFVQVAGGALQFGYQATNVRDDFTTTSYTRNDGNTNWSAASWTESGDDGAAGTGNIQVNTLVAGNVDITRCAAAGCSIVRTAAVSGGSVTISFGLAQTSLGVGEFLEAAYDLGLGGGFQVMATITAGNVIVGGCQSPCTISTAGATTINIRFRETTRWAAAHHAQVDFVNIAFNDSIGSSAQRTANLTGATAATLSFTFASANLTAGDTVVVEASNAAAGPFTTLATFTAGAPNVAPPFSLTPYISANTTVRFRVTGGVNGPTKTFSADNVTIAYNVALAGTDPPNVISSSSAYDLAGGETLTATFNVQVNNPFPTGLTSVTNTASVTSVQLPIQLVSNAVTNIVATPTPQTATVAGRVWLDTDGNAQQDIGEPGIDNVIVTLKDQFGTPVATSTTDSNGRFLFNGVTPGNGYYVEATTNGNPGGLPPGLTQSAPVGNTNNRTTVFNLTAGQNYSQANLGYTGTAGSAIFGDEAYVDANGNGLRDPGEIGLGGVTIKLYHDVNGNNTLEIGTDTLVDTLVAGAGTVAATGGSTAVAGTGTTFTNLQNGDTISIAGVTYTVNTVTDNTHLNLTATYAAGTAAGLSYKVPTRTAPDGSYLFTGITPAGGFDTYFVVARTPSGYTLTTPIPSSPSSTFTIGHVFGGGSFLQADYGYLPNAGTTFSIKDRIFRDTAFSTGPGTVSATNGSTAVVGTGTTFKNLNSGDTIQIAGVNFTIASIADDTHLTLTAGYSGVTGTGKAWNSFATFDNTEAGIQGVTVEILDSSLNVIGTTVTAADGTFSFSGLTGGGADYTIRITDNAGVLTNYLGVSSYAIAGQRAESNVSANTDRSATPSYAFSVSRSIGDTVFNDINGNGLQDAGEPGIAGVVVRIAKDANANGIIDLVAGPGTVTATNGSATVTGTGTATFLDYHAGEPITIAGTGYIIQSIASNTSLTLTTAYGQAAGAGKAYNANPASAGTVTTAAASAVVTGTGTTFLTTFKAGDTITISGADYTVQSVTDNLHLTLTTIPATVAGVNYWVPVFFANVTTDGSGKYLFSGLASGSYIVSVQNPAGANYIGSEVGTVSATTGNAAIVGTGTLFTRFSPGDTITITTAGVPVTYTILSITDDTHLTLTAGFAQATGAGKVYGRPDSDATALGAQLGATIAANGSLLDRDFAFQVPVASQRAFAGKLWNDADKNGVIGGSESGLSGVTLSLIPMTTGAGTVAVTNGSNAVVGTGTTFTSFASGDLITIAGIPYIISSITDATHLTLTKFYPGTTAAGLAYQHGSSVVQTATTDVNGFYTFTGLANSTYVVQVTDTNGNVVGFGPTWEKTEGLITGQNPGNGMEAIDLTTSPGTVATTSGSPAIVGTGTTFTSYSPNDPILINGVQFIVSSVTDNTHLTLTTNSGATTGGLSLGAAPIDFGFALLSSIPTLAKLRSFDAQQSGKSVELLWQTSFENGNLGFNIYKTIDGARTKVNQYLIAGSAFITKIHPVSGYSYRFHDTLPSSNTFAQYWLEDIDTHGLSTMNGPYSTRLVSNGDPVADSPTLSKLVPSDPVIVPAAGIGALQPLTLPPATPAQVTQQLENASSNALKIAITTEGWYRLTAAAMTAAGFTPPEDATKFTLFCDGIKVPIVLNTSGNKKFGPNDSIEFYALGVDTPWTAARTYWLRADTHSVKQLPLIKKSSGSPFTSGVPFVFKRIDRTTLGAELVATGEGTENFFGAIITTSPSTEDLTVTNLDPAGGMATLQVVILGAVDGIQHQITVQLGSMVLGTATVPDLTRQTFTYTFPQSSLSNGANTLTVTSLNGDNDVSALVSATLTYQHLLKADNGLLEVQLPGSQEFTVDGFTSSSIRALDITDPFAPLGLEVAAAPSGGGFKATFSTPPSGTPRTVVVFSSDRMLTPDPTALSVNAPSSWSKPHGHQADLLILTNAAFKSAAATLKTARDSQGILTTIVDVEDIYDEFNFGIKSPESIKAFLQTTAAWTRAPKYVLLLGDASVDPRDYLGLGSVDYVPTWLIPTIYIKTPSDDWYTDFNNDAIGDLPVGRIPVRTAGEAAAVINKIATRSTPLATSSQSVLLVADSPATFDFESEAAVAKALMPANFTVQTIKVIRTPTPRSDIVTALNGGPLLVDYMGHGSVEIWSEDVFDSGDAANLANGTKLPVVLAMTCLNGYFHDVYTNSLASALLNAPNGGAVAVWASSTLTDPYPQFLMNRELLHQLFAATPMAIGDAITLAKQATPDLNVRRSWILFGDPSMRLTK